MRMNDNVQRSVTWNSKIKTRSSSRRRAFTLTELLIVIAIIGIITGIGLSAMAGAIELAREQRTRAIIGKIDQLVMERYESYRTRAVPISATTRQAAYANPKQAATNRLNGVRELMRMELPDRISDIVNMSTTPPSLQLRATAGLSASSLQRSYFRSAVRAVGGNASNLGKWDSAHQGSECLYLIISTMHDGDKNALDFFSSDEIGDTDGDGMKEILDAWGTPIEFLRWPAGYSEHPGTDGKWGVANTDDDNNGTQDDITEAGWPGSDDQNPPVPITSHTPNYFKAPDPFDPLKVDPNWGTSNPQPFALRPLIFSAGRDKIYDVSVESSLIYHTTTPPNNPYYAGPSGGSIPKVGTYGDANQDGAFNYVDNITNHNLTPP